MTALRMISWVTAGAAGVVNSAAVFSWYPEFYHTWYVAGEGSKVEYYTVMVVVQTFLAIPMLCIWFADYLASLEWGDQRWRIPHWSRQASLFPSPVSLFKLVAWIVLLGFFLGSFGSLWSKTQ
jgi:hypothetical protein